MKYSVQRIDTQTVPKHKILEYLSLLTKFLFTKSYKIAWIKLLSVKEVISLYWNYDNGTYLGKKKCKFLIRFTSFRYYHHIY